MGRVSNLTRLRKQMGISQRTMAQLIDSTQQTVSRMEKGEIELTENAKKLMVEYGLDKKGTKTPLKLKPMRNGELKTNELQCSKTEHFLNLKKEESSRDFERWWWYEKNSICLNCIMPCKQSSRVKIIHCPQLQRKNG